MGDMKGIKVIEVKMKLSRRYQFPMWHHKGTMTEIARISTNLESAAGKGRKK